MVWMIFRSYLYFIAYTNTYLHRYLEFNYDFEKAMARCEPEKTKKERKAD